MSWPATSDRFLPPASVGTWRKRALMVAIPFTLAALVGWVMAYAEPDYDQFYRSYLVGYLFCWGLGLGSLAVLMISYATGGEWGLVLRRILEAGSRTLGALAIGFIPILIGIHRLYPWTQADVAKEPHLQQVGPAYLNVTYFIFRAALYFIVWIALAVWLSRQSARQDRERLVLDAPLRAVSCLGLVLYGLTVTFAVIDWVMSLDPNWSSSIFGLLFFAGHGLLTWSFAVVVLALLVREEPMKQVAQPSQFHDNGKLLLTCTMLWGWFALSQWLIIWAGNLPDEISWYFNRTRGGWREFAYFLVIGEFFVPFFLLLSRELKTQAQQLKRLALWILFMGYWVLYWYVMPNFPDLRGHWRYSWQDAVVPIALLSWWLYLFFGNLQQRPLMVVNDDHVRVFLETSHELETKRA